MKLLIRIRRGVLLVLCSLTLAACSTLSIGDEIIPLDVVGYDHMDHDVGSFSVNDSGGSYLGKHEGGGFSCCIGVPRDYKPGMTVKVRYTDEAGDNPQERIVSVPPYRHQDLSMFAVHFLKDGEIKVFVTNYGIAHPDYPLKGDEAKL